MRFGIGAVYVPVVNLVVKTPLRLGNVLSVSNETADKESRQFIEEHRFGGSSVGEQEEQKRVILEDMTTSAQQSEGFAKVSLRAHSKRVVDVAADKSLIALNILRSHTHLFYAHDDKALIGLPRECSPGFWHVVSLGQDESHTFNIQHEDKGPLLPFVFDSEKIKHLTAKCHLGLIQEILDEPSEGRNTLEAALIQAFQSLGSAMVAPTVDMRFLGCTISLERMLIHNQEETTTQRWSDRLAVAMASKCGRRGRPSFREQRDGAVRIESQPYGKLV